MCVIIIIIIVINIFHYIALYANHLESPFPTFLV